MVLKNKHVVKNFNLFPMAGLPFFSAHDVHKNGSLCVFSVTYLNIWNVSTILISYVFESTFGQYGPMKGSECVHCMI